MKYDSLCFLIQSHFFICILSCVWPTLPWIYFKILSKVILTVGWSYHHYIRWVILNDILKLNDYNILHYIGWLENLNSKYDATLLYFSICFKKLKGRILDWLSLTKKIELVLGFYIVCINFYKLYSISGIFYFGV